MKIKVKLLRQFMEREKITVEGLAQKIKIPVSELEKLLSGEAVELKIARAFISYFGADKAQDLIDWEAIGKVNPLSCKADEDDEV